MSLIIPPTLTIAHWRENENLLIIKCKENANYDKRELIIGMSAGNVITSLKAIQSASE